MDTILILKSEIHTYTKRRHVLDVCALQVRARDSSRHVVWETRSFFPFGAVPRRWPSGHTWRRKLRLLRARQIYFRAQWRNYKTATSDLTKRTASLRDGDNLKDNLLRARSICKFSLYLSFFFLLVNKIAK